jgi:hypothetical protein
MTKFVVENPGYVVEDPGSIEEQPQQPTPIKLPTFAESMKEELASRGPLEKFNAGWGVPLETAAYGLKSLVTKLTPHEQQRQVAAQEVNKTPEGMAGSLAAGIAATGPAFGRIAAAPAATSVDVGAKITSAGILGGLEGILLNPGDRAEGAKAGAAGAMLGQAGNQVVSSIFKTRADRALAEQAANKLRDSTAAKARAAGYVIPPAQTNPSVAVKTMEGISGKIQTAQHASRNNEAVTSRLVAKELGIKDVTPAEIQALQKRAGAAYDTLRQQGRFVVDDDYVRAIGGLGDENAKAAEIMPGLLNKEVQALSESAKNMSGRAIQAEGAVNALKQLRFDASKNILSEDPAKQALGWAQKRSAQALEDLINRNLRKAGKGQVLKEFEMARRLFAKTFAVQEAMNPATGKIDPNVFGRQLLRGEPLSGELRTIAESSLAFPKALQNLKEQSVLSISPLDYGLGVLASGGGYATAGPAGGLAGLAATAARPFARMLLLSPAGQKAGVAKYATKAHQLGEFIVPAATSAAIEAGQK